MMILTFIPASSNIHYKRSKERLFPHTRNNWGELIEVLLAIRMGPGRRSSLQPRHDSECRSHP
jgi:hypothetical protein